MTVALYLALISAVLLIISILLLTRAVGRASEAAVDNEKEVSLGFKEDALALEVSARIFNPEDLNFVATETSGQFAHTFREERTTLALGWLRHVRGQVRQLIRIHRRTVRVNSDLKPLDEFRLFFGFLLFQLMSGMLYCVIWVHGPVEAARVLEWSLQFAGKLRKIAEEAVSVATPVRAEIIKTDPRMSGGTKSS